MFIERLLNQGGAPLLEQMVHFTAARHELIAENVVNISTPNYRQKDLSLQRFQSLLQDRVEERRENRLAGLDYSDIESELESPRRGILFHDGNNRSVEQLMSDQAKNAMMHNLAIELLRRQFSSLKSALSERVS